MQVTLRSLFSLLVLALFVVACGPGGETVETGDAVATNTEADAGEVVYNVNPSATMVNWEGSKLTGSKHMGTLAVSGGQILVENNNIVGGEFTIDMNSLTDTDLQPGQGKEKLEGHLKSEDFFETATYPTAKFEIASAQAVTGNPDATHMLTGNLTMKGETKSISFPVSVSMNGTEMTAVTPQFTIDRTDWNVHYGSSTIEGIAQDNIINDKVGLKIDLKASANTAAN